MNGVLPLCVFDGPCDEFVEIPVLARRAFRADIIAVFVIVGPGYTAALQEPFRLEFPTLFNMFKDDSVFNPSWDL